MSICGNLKADNKKLPDKNTVARLAATLCIAGLIAISACKATGRESDEFPGINSEGESRALASVNGRLKEESPSTEASHAESSLTEASEKETPAAESPSEETSVAEVSPTETSPTETSPTEASKDDVSQEDTPEEALPKDTRPAKERLDELVDLYIREELSESALDTHILISASSAYMPKSFKSDFSPVSAEALLEKRARLEKLDEKLSGINPAALNRENRTVYDILKTRAEKGLMYSEAEYAESLYFYEPLEPKSGIHIKLPLKLFAYEFRNRQDIENYLKLLRGIDEYYAEIMKFEKEKSERGKFMSRAMADAVIKSCDAYLLAPKGNFMTESFEERLANVRGISEEEKSLYMERNEEALEDDFAEAYDIIREGIKELSADKNAEKNAEDTEEADKYYLYRLAGITGLDTENPDRLRVRIEIDLKEYSKRIEELFAGGHSMPDLKKRNFKSAEDGLEYLSEKSAIYYPELERRDYEVRPLPESLESSQPPVLFIEGAGSTGRIYINREAAKDNLYKSLMSEGFPGKLYRSLYYTEENKIIYGLAGFEGMSAGWDSYAGIRGYYLDEKLSAEEAELLLLNDAYRLGLMAYLDLYINYYNADREDVAEYLKRYYNIENDSVVNGLYDTLITAPCSYLGRYSGYILMEEMRAEAEERLGDRFDETELHRIILDMGAMPAERTGAYFKSRLFLYVPAPK